MAEDFEPCMACGDPEECMSACGCLFAENHAELVDLAAEVIDALGETET